MLPMTSMSLNSSPASDAIRISTIRAGIRPARSNSSAKQTIPRVTSVIGFHFGLSTGSLPLTRAKMQTSTPSASSDQGQHARHIARSHADGRAHGKILAEIESRQTKGDKHQPGQEVLGQKPFHGVSLPVIFTRAATAVDRGDTENERTARCLREADAPTASTPALRNEGAFRERLCGSSHRS